MIPLFSLSPNRISENVTWRSSGERPAVISTYLQYAIWWCHFNNISYTQKYPLITEDNAAFAVKQLKL
jgi:hypothetical protein